MNVSVFGLAVPLLGAMCTITGLAMILHYLYYANDKQ